MKDEYQRIFFHPSSLILHPSRYNARDRNLTHAVSHIASAKFLCGVWRQDLAAALETLDESQVLRLLRANFAPTALDHSGGDHSLVLYRRLACRSQTSTITTTTHTPTIRIDGDASDCEQRSEWDITAVDDRRGLHLRRENEERDTMLASCSWSSAMLATQRRESDASAREAAG